MQARVAHVILAWLIVAVIATAISAYEIGGTEPSVPWHTISFLSKQHLWLAIVVSALVAALAGGFEVWWWFFHLTSNIDK